jgi:hypothetical protein
MEFWFSGGHPMETQKTSPRGTLVPRPLAPRRALWSRRLAIATAILFFVSSAFPVAAGLSKDTASFPKWWGVLDVALAFVLATMAILISALVGSSIDKEAEKATYRAYRLLTHGLLVMVVVFFLFGDRITWINRLTGFAWRAWLLLYTLPAWFTALRA